MMIKFLTPDFQFQDHRGSLVQLVHGGWNQVNVIKSNSNEIRGGHFHSLNNECFYVISGSFELRTECIKTKKCESQILKEGDFFLIPPNIVHSFNFKEETVLVSMYDKGVEIHEGKKDIYIHHRIE